MSKNVNFKALLKNWRTFLDLWELAKICLYDMVYSVPKAAEHLLKWQNPVVYDFWKLFSQQLAIQIQKQERH